MHCTDDAVESADAMGYRWDGIPGDLFVEILQLLPPSPRRRLRLVCRHWRNVIDDRTPAPQARAKVLAFVSGLGRPRAFVFDDDLITGECAGGGRDLELRGGVAVDGASLVGACNGLLCLRRSRSGGDVVVANPVTGERLAVPPPPSRTSEVFMDAAAYSFAYHPATGLFKVVHVPCGGGGGGGAFDAVNVFTLGDASWRQVPVRRGSSCLLSFGVVSANGAAYWVSNDSCSLMRFDLKDERLAFVATLPVRVSPLLHLAWHLTTDVRGRLGLAVCSHDLKRGRTLKGSKTEVWMLEDARRGNKRRAPWVLRHSIVEPGREPLQEFAWPLVTHGEHVLTTQARGNNSVSLHAYRLSKKRAHGGVVRMETPPSMGLYGDCFSLWTFAYAETTEPLALYRCDEDVEILDKEEWHWIFDRWKGKGRWRLEQLNTSRDDDDPWWDTMFIES